MTDPTRRVLNSYDKESKSEKFTRPLRGFLGGRKVTVDTAGKGKKIYKVSERVFLGAVLFTIGIPYTLVAGAILAFSSPKKAPSSLPVDPKKTVSSSKEIPIGPLSLKGCFNNKELKGFSYLFDDNSMKLDRLKMHPLSYDFEKRDNYEESLSKFNGPTLISVRNNGVIPYYCLIIPIERQNEDGDWERTFCTVGHQPQVRDRDVSISLNFNSTTTIVLGNFKNPSDAIKPYKDLMNGDTVTIQGSKFRLYSVLNS